MNLTKAKLILLNLLVLLLVVVSSYFIYTQTLKMKHITATNTVNQKAYSYLTTAELLNLSPLLPTLKIVPTGKIKEFTLEAREADWEIMPGVVIKAITYNGSVPGPTIEVTEGDLVRVKITNKLENGTSIHWHGLHLPNKQDGVPMVTQPEIKPGETYTYEFLAGHAGTYMYHPHINSVEQIEKGLYGAFIIHPQNPNGQPKFDKDYAFVFGGWNVPQENIDRVKMLKAMGVTEDAGHGDMEMSGNEDMDMSAHGDMEMTSSDSMEDHAMSSSDDNNEELILVDDTEMSSMSMDYNFWTINGKAFPASPQINVKEGERVRIRLINISNVNHPMHLHGTDFRIIAEDSHPLSNPKIVNTIDVAPGKTFDIEFITDNPGNWIFHCHELHHTENDGVEPGGLLSLIKYSDEKAPGNQTNQSMNH